MEFLKERVSLVVSAGTFSWGQQCVYCSVDFLQMYDQF